MKNWISPVLLIQGMLWLISSFVWCIVPDASGDKFFTRASAGMMCLGLFKIISLLEERKQ